MNILRLATQDFNEAIETNQFNPRTLLVSFVWSIQLGHCLVRDAMAWRQVGKNILHRLLSSKTPIGLSWRRYCHQDGILHHLYKSIFLRPCLALHSLADRQ